MNVAGFINEYPPASHQRIGCVTSITIYLRNKEHVDAISKYRL